MLPQFFSNTTNDKFLFSEQPVAPVPCAKSPRTLQYGAKEWLQSQVGVGEILNQPVDREKESLLLGLFCIADKTQLNGLLQKLTLKQLCTLLSRAAIVKQTRAALLDIFARNARNLSVRSKVAVIKALHHVGLDELGESVLRNIFLQTRGVELSQLKESLDCASDKSLDPGILHRDLQELLFVDIKSDAIREEILHHIWREGNKVKSYGVFGRIPARSLHTPPPEEDTFSLCGSAWDAEDDDDDEEEEEWRATGGEQHKPAYGAALAEDPSVASVRSFKLISDIDDTLFCGWKDRRYPAGTVYPGVLDLYAALHYRYRCTPDPLRRTADAPTSMSDGKCAVTDDAMARVRETGIRSRRTLASEPDQKAADEAAAPPPPSVVPAVDLGKRYSTAQGKDDGADADDDSEDAFGITFITARPKLVGNVFQMLTRRALRGKGILNATILSGSIAALMTHARMENKKYSNFLRYRQVYPEFDFVFFGDSGQRDIQFSEILLNRHSESVAGIFIHDVVFMDEPARLALRRKGIIVFDTYVGAALEALRLGLFHAACIPESDTSAIHKALAEAAALTESIPRPPSTPPPSSTSTLAAATAGTQRTAEPVPDAAAIVNTDSGDADEWEDVRNLSPRVPSLGSGSSQAPLTGDGQSDRILSNELCAGSVTPVPFTASCLTYEAAAPSIMDDSDALRDRSGSVDGASDDPLASGRYGTFGALDAVPVYKRFNWEPHITGIGGRVNLGIQLQLRRVAVAAINQLATIRFVNEPLRRARIVELQRDLDRLNPVLDVPLRVRIPNELDMAPVFPQWETDTLNANYFSTMYYE